MDNTFKSEVTIFSNRFEITVNIDCLTSVKSLNIGNFIKKSITREIRSLVNTNVNVSSFKKHQELINKKLDESNLRIEERTGTKKNQIFLIIQYIGLQEKRDKKLELILNKK